MTRLLIVDNDEGLLHFLSRLFVRQGLEVLSCIDGSAALATLADESVDVILLDYKMPGLSGLETLGEIKRSHFKTPVIIMTAHGTTDTAIEAMKLGAYDYLLKPFDTEELRRVVDEAIEVNRLMKEVVSLPGGGNPLTPIDSGKAAIVGSHRKMQEAFKTIGQVADKNVTVLITGESGTGKELVARALYHHGNRRDKPFMAINCASIPDTLFESELFGYEQGAFTGADRSYIGKFERCHTGTLFFDEIGDMSLGTQAKVLRVLQGGEFERLGSSETVRVDVRILAATNKDLQKEVEAGRFRKDLYYRLKIISIHMPPLRDRMDDIPALANYFVSRFVEAYGRPIHYVSDQAISRLKSHPWPGNVRELENCLRRAVLMCQGEVLLPEALQFDSPPETPGVSVEPEGRMKDLKGRIESLVGEILDVPAGGVRVNVVELVEAALIARALKTCAGNQVRAARMLGISRNTLRNRIKKYNLDGQAGVE